MSFDSLSTRRQYASNRRSALVSSLIKAKKDIEWVYWYESELDGLLKRSVGFAEWDKKWDVGLYLEEEETYILLSRANHLGSFEVIERVKYTDELKPGTWLIDCIKKHIR